MSGAIFKDCMPTTERVSIVPSESYCMITNLCASRTVRSHGYALGSAVRVSYSLTGNTMNNTCYQLSY